MLCCEGIASLGHNATATQLLTKYGWKYYFSIPFLNWVKKVAAVELDEEDECTDEELNSLIAAGVEEEDDEDQELRRLFDDDGADFLVFADTHSTQHGNDLLGGRYVRFDLP